MSELNALARSRRESHRAQAIHGLSRTWPEHSDHRSEGIRGRDFHFQPRRVFGRRRPGGRLVTGDTGVQYTGCGRAAGIREREAQRVAAKSYAGGLDDAGDLADGHGAGVWRLGAVLSVDDGVSRAFFDRIVQGVISPHASRHFKSRDEHEDQGYPNEREFQQGTTAPCPFFPAHVVCNLIWTVRVIVNWPVSPGIGIKKSVWYVTVTCEASLPSGPVTCVAVTVKGVPLQEDRFCTLARELISSSAYRQAASLAVEVLVDFEVYSAATRAAFWVAIRALV